MAYQIGLCDDEEYQIKINGVFLKKLAEKKGYDLEYHGFKTGKALREYLADNHLDALLLDIDLGEESGIDVASWIARNYPDIVDMTDFLLYYYCICSLILVYVCVHKHVIMITSNFFFLFFSP